MIQTRTHQWSRPRALKIENRDAFQTFTSLPHSLERDLTGREVLVTGGTSGVGLAAAEQFSLRGARPILWARSRTRGVDAALRVGGRFHSVDLGDLPAVSAAAHQVQAADLAAVVLCTGGIPRERTLTRQGLELMWASQVLGQLLLLRILRRTGTMRPDTRVIWVSSGSLYLQRLDLRDLNATQRYQRHAVFANVKRAQVTLNQHLAERWPELHTSAMQPSRLETRALQGSMPLFRTLVPKLRNASEGADCIAWLAAREAPTLTGRFWLDRRDVPVHEHPRTQSLPGDERRLVQLAFRATEPFLGGC